MAQQSVWYSGGTNEKRGYAKKAYWTSKKYSDIKTLFPLWVWQLLIAIAAIFLFVLAIQAAVQSLADISVIVSSGGA